ncbi:MAG: HesA/MoeB/ThiF family protein [Spirochaetales bacterium]|nr:HesA/MoeB/ThiF family protein [Spirochaetales bacterium]
MLGKQEVTRYSRNILLPEIGRAGQDRLKQSKVVVLGAGGLGSPVLLYLAAAGVGSIRIIDADLLDLSNLQRQILYRSADLGKPKALLAMEALTALNPLVHVEAIQERFHAGIARNLISGADLIIEGFDNFPGKFLANDSAILSGISLISGGILRFRAQVQGIKPGESACLRCLYYEQPEPEWVPSCSEAGVIGALAGLAGALMAAEAIKVLCGTAESILGKLVEFELKETRMRTRRLKRRQNCAICGDTPTIGDLEESRYAVNESCLLP